MHKLNTTDATKIATQLIRETGMSLDQKHEADLAASIAGRLHVDPQAGRFIVLDDSGNPMVSVANDGTVTDLDAREYVARAAARLAKPEKARTQGSAATLTERMVAARATARAAAKKQAADAAKGQNPRAAGSINRTRQAIITNGDPALAQRLRAEAGVAR